VNKRLWSVLVKKVHMQGKSLIENKGADNSEASLKEGVDMRLSEQRHIRDHFQITFMQKK